MCHLVSAAPLSQHSLASVRGVATPTYDRSSVSTGIVHFGLGNFHRAHQAMYLDALMRKGLALDWGICGVGVLASDIRMRDALVPQDCLYTLVMKHADGRLEPRVIGSIHEYLFAPEDPAAVIAKLVTPSTRIVSLTITEGGYNIDHLSNAFVVDNPDVVFDAAHPKTPRTVFGFVVEALRERRANGTAAFTVMSCDNIEGNGDVARRSFSAFARLMDAELADWIEREVSFPNSMVDRITPVTTDDDRSLVESRFGIDDAWPVVCEPFVQWVLEDDFPLGRPSYELVGVQVVDDVEPYELMKLRLLNASHQAIAYFGYLSGHRYAHEAASDPLIIDLVTRYMDEEATPTLRPVPGIDLPVYKATLLQRFANPEIRDTLARLAAESSDRIPKWILPVIRSNIAAGRSILRATSVVASWARYDEAVDEQGSPITVVDPLRDQLVAAAQAQGRDALSFVSNRDIFGDLIDQPRFVADYQWALAELHSSGAQGTLGALASKEG